MDCLKMTVKTYKNNEGKFYSLVSYMGWEHHYGGFFDTPKEAALDGVSKAMDFYKGETQDFYAKKKM